MKNQMALTPHSPNAVLTVEHMYAADRAAMASGVPGERLMTNAGEAIAEAIVRRWTPRPICVLCGPGNNGGDGFVVARLLKDRGWQVSLALLGRLDALKGDAATMASRWCGPVVPLAPEALDGCELVVDALFGAGLARPLGGVARATIEDLASRCLPMIAVDVPSGVDGNSGAVLGAAAPAEITVTFCRAKPGHLLFPGRALTGELIVADIGIVDSALRDIPIRTFVNGPTLWRDCIPWPKESGHKYSRGHALVVGGPAATTGAARLAARAALRVGAGLVTVASPEDAIQVYASQLTAVMVVPTADDAAFDEILADERKNAVLLGPGGGVGETTRRRVVAALERGKACVLDADAITAFKMNKKQLVESICSECLLTPHEGEFRRLFAFNGDKLKRARAAAEESGSVILLKGGDTVVASPDGRAAINNNAPPYLATAGSGDVLAGFAVGLMAQGMPGFEAGCVAAWLHGAAAKRVGPGLIAEDLSEALPAILSELHSGVISN